MISIVISCNIKICELLPVLYFDSVKYFPPPYWDLFNHPTRSMLVAARNPHFGPARKALKTLRKPFAPATFPHWFKKELKYCRASCLSPAKPSGRTNLSRPGGPGPPGTDRSPCPKNQLYQWVIGKTICSWLVVYLPSWKIWVRQWEWWHPIYEMNK